MVLGNGAAHLLPALQPGWHHGFLLQVWRVVTQPCATTAIAGAKVTGASGILTCAAESSIATPAAAGETRGRRWRLCEAR